MRTGPDLYAPHAKGVYSVDRCIWDKTKWCIYSPTGVALERRDDKAAADAEAQELNQRTLNFTENQGA